MASRSISLCGTFDPAVRSSLSATVKTWSPTIHTLVLGADYETKWKYKEAKRLGIPTMTMDEYIRSVPSTLWVDLYKPTKLCDVIGNASAIKDLQTWLRAWSTTGVRAALITGPPGIGKTTAVHLVCKECDYDVVEFNASNERSATAVRKWFSEATRSHHVGKRRIVIMDEVDGMSRGDRGGMGELARMIKETSFPILCIANERSAPRMRPLTSCCLDIRFSRPVRSTIAQSIHTRVVTKQKLNVSVKTLEEVCEQNGNDIRSILNFLQFSSSCSSTKDELLRTDPFSATGRLFGSRGSLEERMNWVFTDFGLVPLMVGEGYIAAAGKGKANDDSERLMNCVRAADAMGDWDILDTRIHRTQNWSLLPSSVMCIVQAATSANGPAPFQIFPSWLGKQSKRLKHMRQMRSMRSTIESRDLLRLRLFRDGLSPSEVVQRLQEYNLTRDDMLETLVDTTFTGDESSVAMDTKMKSAITREWNKQNRSTESEVVREEADDSEEENLMDIE